MPSATRCAEFRQVRLAGVLVVGAESTDLVATASGSVTAAQVAGWLRGLMDAADQPIAAAVTEIDVADATVTVRFAAVEEPSYREVADGHRVLCATAPWCAPAPA